MSNLEIRLWILAIASIKVFQLWKEGKFNRLRQVK
jgi:hypothetical protein